MKYPINCYKCNQVLYGPVKYCPFCGVQTSVVHAGEKVFNKAETIQVPEASAGISTTPNIVSQEPISKPKPDIEKKEPTKPEHVPQPTDGIPLKQSEEKIILSEIKTPEKKEEPAQEEKKPVPFASSPHVQDPIPKPNNLKWIIVAVVLVAVAISGYLFFHKKDGVPVIPNKISESETLIDGRKASARILALDVLRKGTDLSVTINKIPKLEKVLEGARDLGKISPRYQEQIATAEKTVSTAHKDRDDCLLAYFGKVVELSHFTPEQISYARDVINKGDLTLREKKVMELLTKHVDYLGKNKETDPTKLLSDFNMQFNDFVD